MFFFCSQISIGRRPATFQKTWFPFFLFVHKKCQHLSESLPLKMMHCEDDDDVGKKALVVANLSELG